MTELAVIQQHQVSRPLHAVEIRQQVQLIQEVMAEVMKPDVHYGYIPGTQPKNEEEKKFKKPSLLKAGAEKLCMVFHLGPDYEIVDKEREGDHLTITSKCILTHIPTGQRVGSALGSCSTMESKYAYRHGSRVCPQCGAEAIIKGKTEYGGGWLCFRNKGGCGAKFKDGDETIEGQQAGKVANEDKADQYNTVLKMANKRALLAAVLNATAASDIFSQDLLDDVDGEQPEVTETGKRAKRDIESQPRTVSEPKAKEKPEPTTQTGFVNETQIRIMRRKMETPSDEEKLCKTFGVEKITELPANRINDYLAHLDAE